jgi:hypothetical protein
MFAIDLDICNIVLEDGGDVHLQAWNQLLACRSILKGQNGRVSFGIIQMEYVEFSMNAGGRRESIPQERYPWRKLCEEAPISYLHACDRTLHAW